ncbi:USP6 N-terminal-like protein [Ailuropoda melanoleuca]|uniref:USP6 N-terminal-like protein n=1 Tax=Ailuropoda melanoleuca TaxID=9646 RepID=UPI00149419A8|nr:USP6 N-terminal-like protein [Ailuropoda melanoleuca]
MLECHGCTWAAFGSRKEARPRAWLRSQDIWNKPDHGEERQQELPRAGFIPGCPKLLRFQGHHEHILGKALSKLKKHMDEEQMCTGIYIAKWFLQCFIDWTPFSLTLKLWDTYILDDKHVRTATAYTILKVHSSKRGHGSPGMPEGGQQGHGPLL